MGSHIHGYFELHKLRRANRLASPSPSAKENHWKQDKTSKQSIEVILSTLLSFDCNSQCDAMRVYIVICSVIDDITGMTVVCMCSLPVDGNS